MILVSALKKLGPEASADAIRKYVAGLKGWVGINGPYDSVRCRNAGSVAAAS